MSDKSVLVVGAGPVGLLTALGLARAGIRVTVVECEPAIVDSPRAVVYHWSVLDGLERLGILGDALRIGIPKQDYMYRIFRTGETIRWSLDALSGLTAHPYNIHLGQNRLAQIALEHLERLPGTEVLWNTRVHGIAQDAVGVTVQAATPAGPRELRAGWVVGADGARSGVRQALGLEFPGMTWPERFVATNVIYDFEGLGLARATLQVDPQYGAIIVKIDNEGLWRCTYCEDAGLAEEGVLARMPAYFAAILPAGARYELVQHSPYRMHQRAAERFRLGRVVLAGDAAHVTNPTGGLGLTSGMFDCFVLHEALAAVIEGAAVEGVLDRYAEERRRIFWERASPQACENKRLIYHSSDPARLDQDLAGLRRLATDRDFLIERVFFTKRLESPSLLGR
ncbi:MAG TPA: FAD-dependent monooxygenase [Steroidobacteraceae bacterium]|nr:FAD-dependent monooxygenase [Steroidobacteraceae bacterium]